MVQILENVAFWTVFKNYFCLLESLCNDVLKIFENVLKTSATETRLWLFESVALRNFDSFHSWFLFCFTVKTFENLNFWKFYAILKVLHSQRLSILITLVSETGF